MLPEFEIFDDKQPAASNPLHQPMHWRNNSPCQLSMYHNKIHPLG
jgi:hypothetical protein